MNVLRRAALPVTLIAVLAGCAKLLPLTAPAAQSGSANFNVYVAMGTSLSAGMQSAGLAQRHQVLAFPALFAQQAGTPSFTYPRVNLGGWPPLLRLKSLGPPTVIDSIGVQRGAWVNLTQTTAYHHLAVPGALLADVQDVNLNYNPFLPRDATFFNNILREGQKTIPLSMLELVASLNPTYLSFEFGTSEFLSTSLHGGGAPAVPPATWAGLLHLTLDALDTATPTAKKMIFNVPDVTQLPFFNTLPLVELTRAGGPVIGGSGVKYLLGPGGVPLQPGDKVGLNGSRLMAGIRSVTNHPDSGAYGYAVGDTSYLSGFPVPGNGRGLPDTCVLLSAEVTSLRAALVSYNAAIASEASARGYLLVDLYSLLRDVCARGFQYAGTTYTSKFVTGGLFSLDGIHPNDLVHGIIADRMIEAANAAYGARIPRVDLSKSMTASASSLSAARAGTQ